MAQIQMKLDFDTLPLPEDGPTEAEIRSYASRLRISLQSLVARAVIEYVERVAEELKDEKIQAQFRPGVGESHEQ